jgi:hypothetical protein
MSQTNVKFSSLTQEAVSLSSFCDFHFWLAFLCLLNARICAYVATQLLIPTPVTNYPSHSLISLESLPYVNIGVSESSLFPDRLTKRIVPTVYHGMCASTVEQREPPGCGYREAGSPHSQNNETLPQASAIKAHSS